MADFYPVLSRAITGLQVQSPEARRAIYDRAKHVLVTQLRGMDPPVAEADITRQSLALDEVITRIEREHAPTEAPTAASTYLPEPVTTPLIATPQAPLPARPTVAPLLPEPTTEPDLPEPSPTLAKPRPLLPLNGEGASGEPQAAPDRPRMEITPASTANPRAWRTLIVGGGVALGIAAIAGVAYYVNRDNRATPPIAPGTSSATPAPSGGPKINERIGSEQAQVPAPSQVPQPQQPGQPPGSGQRADIAVAQRAVLYIEPADPAQPPRAIVGRVSWRVEAQNAGQGQPLETVIRADADISEAGLSLVFTIRRNTDTAFPASHIIGMLFKRSSDDGNGAVREAGVPQFKSEENERGAPLSAITNALGDNLFVSALSRVPVEVERNVDLIKTRNWVDIPVRFASGKRGIIAFEKGLSGDQRIAEGFRAWP